jgi:hypothetical protein
MTSTSTSARAPCARWAALPPPLPPVLTGHVSSLPPVLTGRVSSLPGDERWGAVCRARLAPGCVGADARQPDSVPPRPAVPQRCDAGSRLAGRRGRRRRARALREGARPERRDASLAITERELQQSAADCEAAALAGAVAGVWLAMGRESTVRVEGYGRGTRMGNGREGGGGADPAATAGGRGDHGRGHVHRAGSGAGGAGVG